MLIVFGGERLEVVVSREGPEETLLGELVLIRVRDAHSNVVVVLDTGDLTPEQELFEVVFGGVVEQLLQAQLELQAFINVENDTVVVHEFEVGIEIVNIHDCFFE